MPTPITAPMLFAEAEGAPCIGPLRCWYCGAPCDGAHPVAVFVKDSFTGRDGVVAPGSTAICAGCVLCLRESAPLTMIDGVCRDGQKMRGYSWVLTAAAATAATKAHLDRLRALCLTPPEPPFALCLSDSGQKHLLYRGVVNHARDPVIVTLETERITFRPADLRSRLILCAHLIAATGKPALAEPPTFNFARNVLERYRDGESLVELWSQVREEPLSRLAAWLSPPKDTCKNDYPANCPDSLA